MTDRKHADQIIVFGLPKGFLHKVSVQAGLHDRVSAPIGKVRDQDILAEPVDISADAVIVFAESQGNATVFTLKAQVVQILWQVQVFADLRVTLTHLAFLGPAPSLLPDLDSHLVQRSLELLQLGLESVSLLGCRERVYVTTTMRSALQYSPLVRQARSRSSSRPLALSFWLRRVSTTLN